MTLGYLQFHQNPNSRTRADGLQYWGYPSRSKSVQVIVAHTAETGPTPWSAESVADYFTISDRPASYHEVGDSNSHVVCLPPGATAFGARGWNSNGWHYSFATRARLWGSDLAWDTAALKVGARRCRIAADLFGIPIRRITLAQAEAGAKGFIDHGRLDPSRRSDPGAGFPWERFLALVASQPKDDVMTPKQEAKLDAVLAKLEQLDDDAAQRWEWALKDSLRPLRRGVRALLESAGVKVEDGP